MIVISDGSVITGMRGSPAFPSPLRTVGSLQCPQPFEGPFGEMLIDCRPCGACGDCARGTRL